MKTKHKNKRLLSALLALAMLTGLFASAPLAASAEDGQFQIKTNPIGAVYALGDRAEPLEAEFYHAIREMGYVDRETEMTIEWFWNYADDNTSRANGYGLFENIIPYGEGGSFVRFTTHIPFTSIAGVKYYYAVLTYKGASNHDGPYVLKEAVTNTARIEIIAPNQNNRPETPREPENQWEQGPRTQTFKVKKVDENGELLSGAVLALAPNENYPQDPSVISYESVTADGYASFTAEYGQYVLTEKQAPDGYNASDDKHYITITNDGVFLNINSLLEQYEIVTFVNKPIPPLNKDDHFAFMQGYEDGTFRPGRNMSRAEAVVMFSRLLVETMDLTADYRNEYYPDVIAEAWYANQVGYMQMLGVLNNYSRDGNFRPNDFVTRAEFATLAAHFDNLTLTATNIFTDVPDDHWAVKYINSAAAKGWIRGYPNGTFMPEANITRAEVVTLVGRMLDRAADEAYLAANKSALPKNYPDVEVVHWAYPAIMEASIKHDYIREGGDEKWTAVY